MLSDNAQLVIESFLYSIKQDIKKTTDELKDLETRRNTLQEQLQTLKESGRALEMLLPSSSHYCNMLD